MNFASQTAEIALCSASLPQFYEEFIRTATTALGAAGGGIFRSDSSGCGGFACNLMEPKAALDALILGSADFSRDEVTRAMAGGTVLDEAVFSARRRDELLYFREIVRPLGGGRSILWLSGAERAVSFFGFIPETRASFVKFAERAVPLLDSALPVLELTHKLFRHSGADADGTLSRSLTLEFKLTAAEHAAMDLVLRGLTNPEIASVLRISVNTVRNRLAACFSKLKVSTRTEAVFVLTQCAQTDCTPTSSLLNYENVLQMRRTALARGDDAIANR